MSLSFSLKNNKARQTHIQKIKNQIKSYLALRTNAFIHTRCINTAKSSNMMVVDIKIKINCIMNLDFEFFINNDCVIFSVFSLFFMILIQVFAFAKKYRINITANISSINSFHIRNKVQNFPFRHSLNVTKVCKKNCSSNPITKILHSKIIRKFIGFEHRLDHRDVSFFMMK